MREPSRPGIPPHLIAIDAIGAAIALLGLWGVFAGGGDVLPFLDAPRVAWSLVAIGGVLIAAVGISIVRVVRARARPRSPGEEE